jgi:GNAT superfamily N-acetyltransferase
MFSISKINKTDKGFYELLGPIFGSRKIAAEVGIHCYADIGKDFYIAKVDEELIGLLSIKGNVISDCYVYPDFRRTGILTGLLNEATKRSGHYRATCTYLSKGVFLKRGFTIKSSTKKFTMMELNNA